MANWFILISLSLNDAAITGECLTLDLNYATEQIDVHNVLLYTQGPS
jgi:hypothetical protein